MRSEVEQERDKEKVESVVTCLVFSFEAWDVGDGEEPVEGGEVVSSVVDADGDDGGPGARGLRFQIIIFFFLVNIVSAITAIICKGKPLPSASIDRKDLIDGVLKNLGFKLNLLKI